MDLHLKSLGKKWRMNYEHAFSVREGVKNTRLFWGRFPYQGGGVDTPPTKKKRLFIDALP